jgi:restriction system protein
MNGGDLERLIGEAFTARGFTVTGFGGGSQGGEELALVRHGQRYLVQLKHFRKQNVDALAVRELATAMRSIGARGGYLVTAGRFTREARELALEADIELIDGEALAGLEAASNAAAA